MKPCFVDLHVHIGRNSAGKRVKMSGARDLTFANIAHECLERKGIDVVAICDSASPRVLSDIDSYIATGEMTELSGGGICYKGKVTVLLGVEMEISEPQRGVAHVLAYFRTLADVKAFSKALARYVRNLNLSTQNIGLSTQQAFELVDGMGGVFVIAHAFTPHKGLLGSVARRVSEVLSPDAMAKVPALELGLSADTDLADRIAELAGMTFLSNSDSHSLPKIGREYNIMELDSTSFDEVMAALRREGGRHVTANYGLDPRLGKYHRTYCPNCEEKVSKDQAHGRCPNCGYPHLITGVFDRILEIQDYPEPVHPPHRPPYRYQVPLEFVPGLGPRRIEKLIERFGSEMAVLHTADPQDIAGVVGEHIAEDIIRAREGRLRLSPGGGGKYGKVVASPED